MARDEFFQVVARFRDVFPQIFRSQFEISESWPDSI